MLGPGDVYRFICNPFNSPARGYRFHPHVSQSVEGSLESLCNRPKSHTEPGAERDSTPGLCCIKVSCFLPLWVMGCGPAVSPAAGLPKPPEGSHDLPPPAWEWVNEGANAVCTYNGVLLSPPKEGNSNGPHNMNQTGGHFAKCPAPVTKRQIHRKSRMGSQ